MKLAMKLMMKMYCRQCDGNSEGSCNDCGIGMQKASWQLLLHLLHLLLL